MESKDSMSYDSSSCKQDSSSSRTSESSKDCYPVKCEKKCKQDCDICPLKCLRPEELVCAKRDAVVTIQSEFILLGPRREHQPINGNTPLAANSRADIILNGNGFFIKGHYLVTSAQLVLLPPSLTSVVNRYPYFDPEDLELGKFKNQMIRASRILVTVNNVNGKKHGFVYQAELVGVDGAGDIAVLRIDFKQPWNKCNPCIENCHPYFKLGKSRSVKEGEKAYLIGDPVANLRNVGGVNAVGAVNEGVISDHRYLEYSGWLLPESVLISAEAYAPSCGMPIIDCQGYVIGMQTTDLAGINSDDQASVGSGYVAGPSEKFMRPVINALIAGRCDKKYDCHLETICDPIGVYYRYRKGYIGVAYEVFTGVDYDVTRDYTSGNPPRNSPRIRLDANGDFLVSPSCKEILGVRVVGLAGANPSAEADVPNGYFYVPGGNVQTMDVFSGLNELPASPLLNTLLPGDQITHLGLALGKSEEAYALGDVGHQIAPSLALWRLCEGDTLKLQYRRGGNALNQANNGATDNYDNEFVKSVCVADYPKFLDYPWYAINRFPRLAGPFYPEFQFPAEQSTVPQLPQRPTDQAGVKALFHPAI